MSQSSTSAFTFQYVSIKTGYVQGQGIHKIQFTFQYVSIKTIRARSTHQIATAFTFQYVSIKTVFATVKKTLIY